MDQKRIILSVIVAMVVVAGFVAIGLWQLLPRTEEPRTPQIQEMARLPQGTGIDTLDPAASALDPAATPATDTPADISGTDTPAADNPQVTNHQEVVVVYGGDASVYTDGAGKVLSIGPRANPGTSATPSSSTTAPDQATGTAVSPTAAKDLGQNLPAPVPEPAKAASVAKATASSSTPARSAPAAAQPAKVARTTQVRVKEFWIQVISSPNLDRVENLKKDLATKGWAGRVSSTEVSSTTYYRLRYGPFGNPDEAARFLGYVKAVPELGASFVVEEYPLKTLAQ